jgi:hypothetical protein
MPFSDEKVQALLEEAMRTAGVKRRIDAVLYRDDYQDYVIVLDNDYHCEIREKLIEDYDRFRNKDIVRQIKFLLEHAVLYEEWEKPGNQVARPADGGDVVVDDSEKYDI